MTLLVSIVIKGLRELLVVEPDFWEALWLRHWAETWDSLQWSSKRLVY